MKRRLIMAATPATLLGAAVIAAGCGGGGSGTAYGASGGAAGGGGPAKTAQAATVGTRHTSLGTVLVDGQGRTLYLFEKDTGTASTCSGGCASIWPPATTTGPATAKGGVVAAKLGTTKRADGTTEVTYAGHPLYTYAADAKPGDVKGQNLDQFGAEWYVLAPSGQKIDNG
jgi:predicted lipoprotein with Yx(FWY)xxD motif